jgi:hypothetical protein
VAGLLRRVATDGGFATVLHKGDDQRGSLLLFVTRRGAHVACLERLVSLNGGYRWERVGPGESAGSEEIRDFLARRTRFDEDLWAIELDIAEPERFIAETTSAG